MNIITSVSFKEVERVTHENASVKGNYLNVPQDFSRDEIIPKEYRKLLAYLFKCVCLGAALPIREKIKLWLMAEGRSTSNSIVDKLLTVVLKYAKKAGLYCFKDHPKVKGKESGKKVPFMVEHNPDFYKNPTRKKNYVSDILYEAARNGNVVVYKLLKKKLNCCPKTLKTEIAKIQKEPERYGLEFSKDGKDGRVLIVRRISIASKNRGKKGDAPLYKETKENLKRNTAGCQGSKNQDKGSVERLAFWLDREAYRRYHYDNLKVKDNPRMRHNYFRDGLNAGIEKEKLLRVYGKALHQRHGDATDMGLNCGMRTFKFELSSTVSLAREMLGISSTRPKYKRQEAVKQNVEVEAVQTAFQKWKKEREDKKMKEDEEYQIYRQLPIDGISISSGYMIDGSGYTAAASEVKPELDKEVEGVASIDWGNEIFGSDWL